MASARGAAPAGIAGRMQLVVVQEKKEHELGGRGESRARGRRLVARASAVPTSTLLVTGAALQVAPNILSIAHRDRLLGGALYAPLSRVDRTTLLRRAFDVDVTRCTGCAGRMTVRAVVTAPASIDRPRPATAQSQPPHAPTADPAPRSSEPSPLRWPSLSRAERSGGRRGAKGRRAGDRRRDGAGAVIGAQTMADLGMPLDAGALAGGIEKMLARPGAC